MNMTCWPGWLKKISCRLKDQAGIGLVETLVAIAILGTGVTAFVSDLSAGSLAVNIRGEATLAQGLAQTQMEVIKAAPYDKNGRAYPAVETPAGYSVGVAVDSSLSGDENLQKVTVTVGHDGNNVLTLEDFKAKR